MSTQQGRVKVMRGAEVNRQTVTPNAGELIATTDLKEVYLGDGVTPGGVRVNPYNVVKAAANQADPTVVGSLSWWITRMAGNDGTVLIMDPLSVTSDYTVPENICLKFEKGGKVVVAEGVTLTINGSIEAGLWHIFDGPGTVTGSPKIEAVYPEWFGAKGDGITDDRDSIQKTLDSFRVPGQMVAPAWIPESSPIVRLLSKKYRVGSSLSLVLDESVGVESVGLLVRSYTNIEGAGIRATTIIFDDELIHGVALSGSFIGVRGLGLDSCNKVDYCVSGFRTETPYLKLSEINIRSPRKVGVCLSTYVTQINNVSIVGREGPPPSFEILEQEDRTGFQIGVKLSDISTSVLFNTCHVYYCATGYRLNRLHYSRFLNCASDVVITTFDIRNRSTSINIEGQGWEFGVQLAYMENCGGIIFNNVYAGSNLACGDFHLGTFRKDYPIFIGAGVTSVTLGDFLSHSSSSTNSYLPHGNSGYSVYVTSGSKVILKESYPLIESPIRYQSVLSFRGTPLSVDEDILYYVNNTTGDDSNTGRSVASSFKTIQRALNVFTNVSLNSVVKIMIAPGTYSGGTLYGLTTGHLGGLCVLQKDPNFSGEVVFSGRLVFQGCGIRNMKWTNWKTAVGSDSNLNVSGSVGLYDLKLRGVTAFGGSLVCIHKCHSADGLIADTHSFLHVLDATVGTSHESVPIAINSIRHSVISLFNVSGYAGEAQLRSDFGGVIIKEDSVSFSGGSAEVTIRGGVVR